MINDRYTKIPVTIQAEQFTIGTEFKSQWMSDAIASEEIFFEDGELMVISSHSEVQKVHDGDYIIKGVMGELYPCPKDVFEITYIREII